jgi:hypothetical protein
MTKKYPLTAQGYFGRQGKGNARVIVSNDQNQEAKCFYAMISKGGEETALPNGHGRQTTMKYGGVVVYRGKTSTPNSPAVSLSKMKGKIKNQKIHFEKEQNNE